MMRIEEIAKRELEQKQETQETWESERERAKGKERSIDINIKWTLPINRAIRRDRAHLGKQSEAISRGLQK
ncbi:hypothetical protein EVAR_5683_1 [Eumeta japonica]|uniref:Uncharacterized protein n=1 Tax=Eumeta variegata TaxID=151549 RepID=A0A4C1T7H9_EUMVA|nr:hypothetical protein EVAR_5683_1 [Eumeta japonica]